MLLVVSDLTLVVVATKHLAISSCNTLAMLPRLAGSPVLRFAGNLNFVIELVNLLKGETLGLVDEEVDESNADEAAPEPDKEDLGLEVGLAAAVIDEVGSRVSCNMLVTVSK